MEKHLVIGLGQIGRAVRDVLSSKYGVDGLDLKIGVGSILDQYDVLHICFPYSEGFQYNVHHYIKKYEPKLVIVYSTTQVGTCNGIGPGVVHSPVEGKHPNLAKSIRLFTRWIGCASDDAREAAVDIWRPLVRGVRMVDDSSHTELLKLRSTSKYAINIAWTQYEKECTDMVGMDFELVKEFDQDYNSLYEKLGYDDVKRYILDPPNNKIGGHCLVPNAKLLNEFNRSNYLDDVIGMER